MENILNFGWFRATYNSKENKEKVSLTLISPAGCPDDDLISLGVK